MLTETQLAIRDAARAFAQERIKPQSAGFEQAGGFPDSLFREVAGLGLMGMTAPQGYSDAGGYPVFGRTAGESG